MRRTKRIQVITQHLRLQSWLAYNETDRRRWSFLWLVNRLVQIQIIHFCLSVSTLLPREKHPSTQVVAVSEASTLAETMHVASYEFKANKSRTRLEINVHHLRGNAIPAGHVQNSLSDSNEILFRSGIPRSVLLSTISTGIEIWV